MSISKLGRQIRLLSASVGWTVYAMALASKLAMGASNILILNSDLTVEKYRTAQAAFRERIAHPVAEVDLGSVADERVLRNTIARENPSVIYCIGSKAYLAAQEVARGRTLLFSSVISWRRFPATESTYGIASELPAGTQLTLFRYFFPDIRKIGVLYSEAYNREWVASALEAARDVGIELVARPVRGDPNEVLSGLLDSVDGLWLIADPVVLAGRGSVERIFQVADSKRKPVFTYDDVFEELGPSLIISIDTPTVGRQAAGLASRLVSGDHIEERVQSPAGSSITLNMRRIEQYSIRLNMEALDSVSRIIK